MALFTKLFANKSKSNNPDNSRLLKLLDIYWKNKGEGDSYKNVVLELMNGNSFLMFPTKNDFKTDTNNWTVTEKEISLKTQSLLDVDGLKVLAVFTDEQSLMTWVRTPTEFTAMRSQDVLKFAQDNNVSRIIINNNLSNMFVLERNRENVTKHQIKQGTNVQIGVPNKPLAISLIKELIDNFKKNRTILEVYQYGQTKEDEFSIVLGFKLLTNSDNAKKAALNIVQNAVGKGTLEQPIDLFFIETNEWYEAIKKIENSLIYKK